MFIHAIKLKGILQDLINSRNVLECKSALAFATPWKSTFLSYLLNGRYTVYTVYILSL